MKEKAKQAPEHSYMQQADISAGFQTMLNQLRENRVACLRAADAHAAVANELRDQAAELERKLKELDAKHQYSLAAQQAMLREAARCDQKAEHVKAAMNA